MCVTNIIGEQVECLANKSSNAVKMFCKQYYDNIGAKDFVSE